ncbi:MAG: hypothetical protein Ta2A_19100 [Treponemataceae bacterium]|nr:MAG: hypothetical protein Ta2A_19100 [Treponemataceae bacterium]
MKHLFVLLLFLTTFHLYAQEIITKETENATAVKNKSTDKEIDYDKTGVIVSVGAFNYFSIGLGFNVGKWHKAGSHFGGYNYGAITEYKTKDELHFRIYGNIYGGVTAMHIGASAIFCTNFTEITGGLAPEIGLGLPGGNLFYRYNFYFSNYEKYNCHEIVLQIYPINRFKKSIK